MVATHFRVQVAVSGDATPATRATQVAVPCPEFIDQVPESGSTMLHKYAEGVPPTELSVAPENTVPAGELGPSS